MNLKTVMNVPALSTASRVVAPVPMALVWSVCLLFAAPSSAVADEFTIDWSVIAAAGGTAGDHNLGISGTAGQSGAGWIGSPALNVESGFWNSNPFRNAPVAGGPFELARKDTLGNTKIRASDLLALATDPEGYALSIISAGPNTESGVAAVGLLGDWIVYSPNRHNGTDSFTYVVVDVFGSTAIGTVNVSVEAASVPGHNITSIQAMGDGSVRITFSSAPSTTHQVHRTENINPIVPPVFWTTVGTVTTDGTGAGTVTDPRPPGTAFYRTVRTEGPE